MQKIGAVEIHFQPTIIFNMEILFSNQKINNKKFDSIIERYVLENNKLVELNTSDLVDLFSSISKYWASDICKIKHIFLNYEMGFLIAWLKKKNLNNLLKINFNDLDVLDMPNLNSKDKYFIAKPQGIALHWLAGNVPVLGVISLFQSLLTKNKSIIKVPMNFKTVLPDILNDLKKNNNFNKQKKIILKTVLDSIIVLYVNKENKDAQRKLSQLADVRIAWGGFDGISSFLKLPKKLNCRDIVFGPKISLAFIKKEKLKKRSDLLVLSKLVCDDIIPFNQMGCNSPHNLLIEKGSAYKLDQIANAIKDELEKRKLNLKFADDPLINFNILTKKFIFQTEKNKSVISGTNNNWNIFINKNEKPVIEDPLFKKNIFISEVKNYKKLAEILPKNTQSLGILCNIKDRVKLINYLSNYNIDRFPNIGKMSLYQNPWDGYLPLHDMVRWISTN